ncbi:MAG: cell division protein FtsA [Campylobacterota bacterium]|nr:cell division protein FtsA [Campylobacterota bacterium]
MNDSILAIDIGATNIISIVATNDFNNKINILGVSKVKSSGVEKGNIVDINLAGNSINESVINAISSSGSSITKAVVSISGANTRTLSSNGVVNIPSGQITENEIKQVLKMALYNANVITDYDVIHVLPIFFRVDDGSAISNPLNMNGTRLEVVVNVITAKKSSLVNIKNALKIANLEVDKFVLSGYASAIATLESDQKKLGSVVINLGGTTSQLVVYKDSTIIYSDFLPIGSEHITNDISVMLHTPYSAANMVKKQYGTLLPNSDDENEQNIKKVKLPLLGNETETKEISLEQIQPILHARIEEIFSLIHDRLNDGSVMENIGGGVILTGGMTFIPGIKELASLIFSTLPVKISNPKNIQNGYIDFNDPTMTTIVGLLLYELDSSDSFELDSNSDIKSKTTVKIVKAVQDLNNNIDLVKKEKPSTITEDIKDIGSIKDKKDEIKIKKPKKLGSFLDKISRWI